ERLAILGGDEISGEAIRGVLPVAAARPVAAPATGLPARPLSQALDDYERELITTAIHQAGGNVAEAARLLRTDRPNLYRRMRRLGLEGSREQGEGPGEGRARDGASETEETGS
ncbi:MAG TPA: helix-turn-helix domain-containing protein, partial [Gemmatimonadales bacterium]|nr:helix-turn-helix domain-containing protein [Gemmatimonadales bacterium]